MPQSDLMCLHTEDVESASLCLQRDRLLQDQLLTSNTAKSLLDCFRQCLQDPVCESINYRAQDRTCQLNKVVALLDRSLTEAVGYKYGAVIRPSC